MNKNICGKRLELLKEIIPKLSRVAVFRTSTQPGNTQSLNEVDLAAKAFGVQLRYLDVQIPKDIGSAFGAASKGRAQAALMMVAGGVVNAHRMKIVDLAVKSRLPAIYESAEEVEAGGLMSYGVDRSDLDRRRGPLRGQNPEGPQTCRLACRAADEVRVHRQSEHGQTDGPDDSA